MKKETPSVLGSPESYHCLNCGYDVTGFRFCPHCGQKVANKRVSFKHLLHDFAGDYITFDSKLFRSIVPLLFKPGFLTIEYNKGRRMQYIQPTRLFLFVSFIFFLLLSIHTNYEKIATGSAKESLVFSGRNSLDSVRTDTSNITQLAAVTDSAAQGNESWLQQKLTEKFSHWKSGDEVSLIKVFMKQIPKFLLLCIPLIALLLKLFYIRRKFYYIEHLIFALHLQSFVFIIIIPIIYLAKAWIVIPVVIIIAVYQFLAFLAVYKQSVFKTLVKYSLVTFSYLLILGLAMTLGLLWSFLTF